MANAVTGVTETFQVILDDPAYVAGDSGDGIITMNYENITATDNETGYATVGIQNEDRDDAVLYTYWNLYPRGAVTISGGSSITFRTVVPQAQGILKGEVTNAFNGVPVDGATINVLNTGLNVITAEDGKYQGSLVVGTYGLAVNHPSFAPDTTYGVVIMEGLETVKDFALTDIAGPLFEMQTIPESTGDTTGPYDVVFKVSDYSGIQETRFFYTSSSSGGPFELIPQAEGPADTWRVSIPGQADGSLVQYWLTSTDITALTTTEPAGAPFTVHSFMVGQTTVVYSSDMENASDWTGSAPGDNATTGVWVNVDPNGVFEGTTEISPEDDHSVPGTMCWVTGQDAVGGCSGRQRRGRRDHDPGVAPVRHQQLRWPGSPVPSLVLQQHRQRPGRRQLGGPGPCPGRLLGEPGKHPATNQSWQMMNFILAEHLTLGAISSSGSWPAI